MSKQYRRSTSFSGGNAPLQSLNQEDLLMLICRRGSKKEVSELLKKQKELVNCRDIEYDQTALHVAAGEGKTDLVTMLVDKFKADVNAVDRNGWTPLHSAANGGHADTVQYLINKGSFVRAPTQEGSSPLHYFVRNDVMDPLQLHKVISLFVERGSDVNQQNKYGESPLHQAAMKGRVQCCLNLLNHNADPNLKNKFGETPLHFAARHGHSECIVALLRFGADPTIKGKAGNALDQCPKWLSEDIKQLLAGGSVNVDKQINVNSKPTATPAANIPTEKLNISGPAILSSSPPINVSPRTGRSVSPLTGANSRSSSASPPSLKRQSSDSQLGDSSLPESKPLEIRFKGVGVEAKGRSRSSSLSYGHSPLQHTTPEESAQGSASSPPSGGSSPLSPSAIRKKKPQSKLSTQSNDETLKGSSNTEQNAATAGVAKPVINSTSSTSNVASSTTTNDDTTTSSSSAPALSQKSGRSGSVVRERINDFESICEASSNSVGGSGSGSGSGSGGVATPMAARKKNSPATPVTKEKKPRKRKDAAQIDEDSVPDETISPPATSASPAASEVVSPTLSSSSRIPLWGEVAKEKFSCFKCEYKKPGPPLQFFLRAPHDWEQLSPTQREKRAKLSADLCSIDDNRYFIRGMLEISVISDDGPTKTVLQWGVWVKVTAKDFFMCINCWNKKDSQWTIEGELGSALPFYTDCVGLALTLHPRVYPLRPGVTVTGPSSHRLYQEQVSGIAQSKIEDMISRLTRSSPSNSITPAKQSNSTGKNSSN